jgi:hypothetical protein
MGGVFLGGYIGVYAACPTTGDYGVYAQAPDAGGAAVYALATGTTPYGVFGSCPAAGEAGYFAGDVTVTGTFTNPSDRRFKDNINDASSVLGKVMNLSAKNYYYKGSQYASMNFPSTKQTGFIAQDLEQIFPELVTEQVQRVENPNDRTDRSQDIHFKGINYIGLIPILTKALQEQQTEIESLKAQINKLK